MRPLVLTAALTAMALPVAAQQNPFKLPRSGLRAVAVGYTLTGDMTGTAALAMDGAKSLRRQSSTMKMMGKTVTSETWSLTTPDSIYRADIGKKTGTVAPNLLPYLATAYDNLDGAGKKRFHQNMDDMASMFSRAFGLASINAGEKLGTKSYAGQECEEKKFGTFTVCTMTSAPIALHTQSGLLCFNYEETAIEVSLKPPPREVFAPPEGIVFSPDKNLVFPDSAANGMVGYLASQQLSDSLAAAKAKIEEARSKQAASGQPTKATPEQEAQMQQACEMMKSLDINKMMADVGSQMMKALGDQAKQAAKDAAKNAATNKLKGLFHKPKIP